MVRQKILNKNQRQSKPFIKDKKKHLTAIYKLARSTLVWNQCCFLTSVLKSLVIVAIWLALIGAIYSRIAHLTINLQESEIYFCNFTNQLNQWFTVTIISQQHWYGRGKANQQLDRDNYFLVHSEWNLKSTLLVIPPGFTTKTQNKEISKGSYNTSGDPPWKPNAYLYHSSSRYHCTQEGGSLAERWYLKQLLVTPEQEQRAF